MLVRSSFCLIKSIYGKIVKSDMAKSLDTKIANILVMNRNQCIGRILENIVGSDLALVKAAFIQFKLNLVGIRTATARV